MKRLNKISKQYLKTRPLFINKSVKIYRKRRLRDIILLK
jgi:hypothetical protein